MRKLISRVSPNGFKAGWNIPSLSDLGRMYPLAQAMRQRAENAGWRSRDIAVAIVMGMSLEHQKQADAGNNPEDKEAAKEFFMSLMDAVFAHKDWYNTDNLQQAGVWANELVPPKELA